MIRISQRLRDERGMAAVFVAIVLLVLFATAALAIDAGSLWASRRGLITDTDAAALAAAQYMTKQNAVACAAASSWGTTSFAGKVAGDQIDANDAQTSYDDFDIVPNAAAINANRCAGHVRVEASHAAQLTFAGVLGIDNIDVGSVSMAQWGPLYAAVGIRPIGLCSANPHFVEWTTGVHNPTLVHPSTYGSAEVHRITFEKEQGGACGAAPGNWTWIDFDGVGAGGQGNSGGVDEIRPWMHSGYPGTISLGDTALNIKKDCNPTSNAPNEPCEVKTGALGSAVNDELTYLRDNAVEFPIVIFDNATAQGANVRYNQVAFLIVRVHGFQTLTGNDGWMDLEFLDTQWSGSVGISPGGAGLPTVDGTELCGGNFAESDDNNCNV